MVYCSTSQGAHVGVFDFCANSVACGVQGCQESKGTAQAMEGRTGTCSLSAQAPHTPGRQRPSSGPRGGCCFLLQLLCRDKLSGHPGPQLAERSQEKARCPGRSSIYSIVVIAAGSAHYAFLNASSIFVSDVSEGHALCTQVGG